MKINILFVIKNKSNTNYKKKCPIGCRITLDKKRKEFSTGQFINPKHWDGKLQIVKPPEPDSDNINTQLSLIRTKLTQAFLLLQVKEASFTVDDIYSLYKGEKLTKEYNLVEYFERYLKRLKTLVEIDIKQITYNKFEYVKNDVQAFVKWKFKTNDFPLKKLELQFLNDFEFIIYT